MFIPRSEYEELKAKIRSLEYQNSSLMICNERMKKALERYDRDIRSLTAEIAGTDIDYPNGKGGNADNTGATEDIDFSDF